MTWSTSDVAVCCSNDSVRSAVRSVRSSVRWRSSLSSRAFSMAMTAWSAKVGHQLDLLVGEWPHRFSPRDDDANQRSFSQEWDAEKRMKFPLACPIRVFGVGQNVEDMNDFAFKQDPPGYRSTVNSGWVTCEELGVFTREPVARFEVVSFALQSTYGNRVRLAQPRRQFDQSIEHRLQVEGRTADDLEHVGGRGLPLQRLVQLASEPRDFCFQVGGRSTAGVPSLWRNAAFTRCRLRSLRVRGFATCSGAPSHCRPSAHDKASWRDQTSTPGDGSSQCVGVTFALGLKKRSFSKTAQMCAAHEQVRRLGRYARRAVSHRQRVIGPTSPHEVRESK